MGNKHSSKTSEKYTPRTESEEDDATATTTTTATKTATVAKGKGKKKGKGKGKSKDDEEVEEDDMNYEKDAIRLLDKSIKRPEIKKVSIAFIIMKRRVNATCRLIASLEKPLEELEFCRILF